MNEKDLSVELAKLQQKVEDLNEFVKQHIIDKIDASMKQIEKIEKVTEGRFRYLLYLIMTLFGLQVSSMILLLMNGG